MKRLGYIFLALSAASLSYATGSMKFLGTGRGTSVKISTNGGSFRQVFGGELKMRFKQGEVDHSFSALCTTPQISMLSDWFGASKNNTNHSSLNNGAKIANLMRTIAPTLFSGSVSDANNKAMALQVAVWELAYETSSTFSMTGGSFRAKQSNGDSFTSGQIALINSYLAVGASATTVPYYIAANNCSQNVVEAVPEPATLAVLGVGALSLLRRRKKS